MKLIENLRISPKIMKAVLTLAVPVVLVTTGNVIAFAEHVASTILLDVNPSIEITANEADEVIEVTALNKDAEAVIGDMDLESMDLDVAINVIVDSMVQHGYIDETKNAVLVTVDSDDDSKQKELEDLITTGIAYTLAGDDITPVIFTQKGTGKGIGNTNVKAFAKEHDISVNKAAFIQKILRENEGLSEEELVAMNVESLSEIIRSKNIDLHDSVGYSDKTLTKTEEKAIEKAAKATKKQAETAMKTKESQPEEAEKQTAAETQSKGKPVEATVKADEHQAAVVENQAPSNERAIEAQNQAVERQAAAEAQAAEKQAEAAVKAVEAQNQTAVASRAAEAQAVAKQAEANAKAAEKQAEADAKANAAAQAQAAEKPAGGNGNNASSDKKNEAANK